MVRGSLTTDQDTPKTCPSCHRHLTWADFSKRPNGSPRGYCKACEVQQQRERRREKRAGIVMTKPKHHRPTAPPGEKWCWYCQQYHPLDQFVGNTTAKDGKQDACKLYHAHRNRAYRERQPEKERRRQRLKYERKALHAPPIVPALPTIRPHAIVKYDGQFYRIVAVRGEMVLLSDGRSVAKEAIAA